MWSVSITTYFELIGHRHCSELGRLVLNACIPLGLFILETVQFSSVHVMRPRLLAIDG